MLFLSFRASGVPRASQIWVGQYAGIAVLVAISVLAALGLTVVPDRWVGLLGLIPLGLGIRGLVRANRDRRDPVGAGDDPRPVIARGALPVAAITIANGADNISVYTPMLRTLGLANALVTAAVFAALVAAWCAAGAWLGSHRAVIAIVERYGQWIVPAVFIVLGFVILAPLAPVDS